MLEASGRYRIRYADIFRAVGNYLDASDFRDITLIETPDGFLVKGMVLQPSEHAVVLQPGTYLFTNDDLDALLEQALERRGVPLPAEATMAAVQVAGVHTRYEDALRSIGYFIDAARWHEVVVMQTAGHVHIKGIVDDEPVDRLVDAAAMREIDAQHRSGRDHFERSPLRRLSYR
jgi:hypothetical protein